MATAGRKRIEHPALGPLEGTPLELADPSDQERLSLVLQGAALLAHLEHGGCYLPGLWSEARVREDGQLKVGSAEAGRFPETLQERLRALLLAVFRSPAAVAGRGAARRAARRLLQVWRQTLLPLSGDRAVEQIFEAAPFLWQEAFGRARGNLLAVHRIAGRRDLWLAGPGHARRRFLGSGQSRREVEKRLRGEGARRLWEGGEGGHDPHRLVAAGRPRRAVAIWRHTPPEGREERLALARAMLAGGLFEQCLELLGGHRTLEARLLRLRCLAALGEVEAASRAALRLGRARLDTEQLLGLGEVAVRLLASQGKLDRLADWAAKALQIGRGRHRGRALLVAALAAEGLGQHERMDELLAEAEPLLRGSPRAWEWHKWRASWSQLVGQGHAVVEHASAALASRRVLPLAEAGRLWSELALGRVMIDDLSGAERACRHALRLLAACEGPLGTTLAEFNLAEIRLRRGQFHGVESTLEASTAEHRRTDNRRSLLYDLELWVRYELAQGRCSAALARAAEAREQLPEAASSASFAVLSARAQGWLGRKEEAARSLRKIVPADLKTLEPEELPALFALAGLPDRALEEAAETPWWRLWQALLGDLEPASEIWADLSRLEPYRAARLVLDCELARPSTVPPALVQRAVATFLESGAEALAEHLQQRSNPWRALARYLEAPGTVEAFATLLAEAGFGECELIWERSPEPRVLIPGPGGPRRLRAGVREGELQLSAEVETPPLSVFLQLFARDFVPPSETREGRRSRRRSGIIGESSALREALERAARLGAGDLPVLISGESGTGKEMLARRVHASSRRLHETFLAINCAALPPNLMLSELFGHVRGAFTGAEREHRGFFEAARGGTLFLDEIGDLPASAQGMLLRTLQEGEIRRLGESFARKVDVRIVAATHRDLGGMVASGSFRQDLYFRLKVATVRLPPLRERGEDLLLLADHFLTKSGDDGRSRLSRRAISLLHSYSWPGNVRELENVLGVAAMLAGEGKIGPEHLDLPVSEPVERGDYHQQIEDRRRELVEAALEKAGGNRAEAARSLGLTRQALSYLSKRFGL